MVMNVLAHRCSTSVQTLGSAGGIQPHRQPHCEVLCVQVCKDEPEVLTEFQESHWCSSSFLGEIILNNNGSYHLFKYPRHQASDTEPPGTKWQSCPELGVNSSSSTYPLGHLGQVDAPH